MKKIIFASKNEGKVFEVREILKDLNLQIISLSDIDFTGEIEETGSTFEENAKIKASFVYSKYKVPTIADDSGLVVEQLNGEPGILSARYANNNSDDVENNKKLIAKLKNHPQPHRAKFVCSAVFFDGSNYKVSNGEVLGRVIENPRGSRGFGYDPLFIPDGYDKTMAELEPDVKNKISHRFNAFSKLKKILS